MVQSDHANSSTEAVRDAAIERFNRRLGLVLFAAYLLVYTAYVLVNAFWPSLMDRVPFAGLNVAIIAALALLVGAFAVALAYTALCRSPGKTRP